MNILFEKKSPLAKNKRFEKILTEFLSNFQE